MCSHLNSGDRGHVGTQNFGDSTRTSKHWWLDSYFEKLVARLVPRKFPRMDFGEWIFDSASIQQINSHNKLPKIAIDTLFDQKPFLLQRFCVLVSQPFMRSKTVRRCRHLERHCWYSYSITQEDKCFSVFFVSNKQCLVRKRLSYLSDL